MEKENEPGTARHGNFINYYEFNPPERRLSVIPPNLIRTIAASGQQSLYCLDVGCNSGDLTQMLYQQFEQSLNGTPKEDEQNTICDIHIHGIDIDENLVTRCSTANPHSPNVTFMQADICTKDDRERAVKSYLHQHHLKKFNLVSCFSLTMWIHLNYGDEAFQDFLKFISNITQYILLEPQPWKCYRNAVRRMKRTGCAPFNLYPQLQWREDVDSKIVEFMKNCCDMNLVETLGTTSWDRKIFLFKRE